MKHILLITLFALCSSAFAQDKKLSFGVQAGYSSSTTSEKGISENGHTRQHSPVGFFVAGLYLNYQITESFSVQPELMYSQKGFIRDTYIRNATSIQDNHQEYKINYIGVPVLAKLGFGKTKSVFALAGVAPQFKVSSKYIFITDVVTPVPYSASGEVSGIPSQSFDAPIVLGLGFERPIGSTFASLNIRYNIGLTDFNNSRLSSFMIIAGIRI